MAARFDEYSTDKGAGNRTLGNLEEDRMTTVDVAVMIPVYNQAVLVLKALDSVARQSMLPRRLLVLDDGSTDGTAEAVAGWIRANRLATDVSLIRQPRNRGSAAALNRGLAIVGDCRYLAVLDSDDLWPADFIERGYGALAAKPEAVAATCDQLHVFDQSKETRRIDAYGIASNATCWLFTAGVGIVSATMLTTQNIVKLGGVNEHLRTGHDTELLLSLSLLGPWLHVPGSPAVILRPSPHEQGNSTHLSAKYFDNERTWAQIHEDFISRRHGGKHAVPRRLYIRVLSDRWNRAGHQLMQAGRTAEARRCFRRSLYWRPWRSSVWARLLKTYSSKSRPQFAELSTSGGSNLSPDLHQVPARVGVW